jgi:hypothetical protein
VQLIEELLLRRKGCDNISNDMEEWSEGGKKVWQTKRAPDRHFQLNV